jgi:N-acetyl-alpha-D-muramate 1-phosphate uridylyltransferase
MAKTAMILAAGRGARLAPLTDAVPKPLIDAGGKPLILWQLERLRDAGFTRIVVNLGWLGEQIRERLGDGSSHGVEIVYSDEVKQYGQALETAGAMFAARTLLGSDPVIVTSGDVFIDFDFSTLRPVIGSIRESYPRHVAHVVMTNNPPFHPLGDMTLAGYGDDPLPEGRPFGPQRLTRCADRKYNFAGITVIHPKLLAGRTPGEVLRLFPWLFQFADAGMVTGEYFNREWHNVGTLDDLEALRAYLRQRA